MPTITAKNVSSFRLIELTDTQVDPGILKSSENPDLLVAATEHKAHLSKRVSWSETPTDIPTTSLGDQADRAVAGVVGASLSITILPQGEATDLEGELKDSDGNWSRDKRFGIRMRYGGSAGSTRELRGCMRIGDTGMTVEGNGAIVPTVTFVNDGSKPLQDDNA